MIASSPSDLQPVLDTVAERADRLCGAASARIYLVEGDAQSASASSVAAPMHAPNSAVGPGWLGHTTAIVPQSPGRQGHPGAVGRSTSRIRDTDEFRALYPLAVAGGSFTRTRLLVPLSPRMARRSACSALDGSKSSPVHRPEIALLETFADQAVIAIENARLFQELQDRVGELQALGEVGQAVSSSLDLQRGADDDRRPTPPAWPAPTAASSTSTTRTRASSRSAPPTR